MQSSLKIAWDTFWTLKKHREEPLWARIAVGSAIAVAAGTLLMAISGVLTGRESDPGWWRASYPFNMVVCLLIAWFTLALARLLEKVLPERWLARLSDPTDWRAMVICNLALAAALTEGSFSGLYIAAFTWHFSATDAIAHPLAQARFYILVLVVSVVAWIWWLVRLRQHQRQRALQLMATEAQLRLLQGQIEPHFLFNTLANVESLMDADPPRARRMLEAFTDYLRAGLTQMREGDSHLAAELDMAERYLELMGIRMGGRLAYRIDADATVRAVRMPTLLLQPLIENAIHHGIEGKVEGGTVTVSARLDGGRLVLRVDDDGLGQAAAQRPHRRGAGMALANIRSRLQARYGAHGSLALDIRGDGASAVMTLTVQEKP
ncbi:hypothetical protein GCM10027277_47430 [Pseudoduganella ginsengisoli]|uniref:Sensor histidine kinase n=1 Tax=Pseudoduganella ginsengisoli TaxID=1462440 RepID=A0A6L6Q3Q2_9BURK|nr:histidine kinase [Pseudoduganella ginsengisoli]MTW04069.1 sensor histidine kinase [Pseudoduganella ginsengisoli]